MGEKMNKRKIIIVGIALAVVGLVSFLTFIYFTKQDKNTTLTILEKQWIEENQNNIIDLSVVNNIPIFNYDGKGLFFDFIDSLEKDTGLNFNKISIEKEEKDASDYSFNIEDKVQENDIVIFEDNYAVITRENKRYNDVEDIPTMTIGVLESDQEKISHYLSKNDKLTFKKYTTLSSMLTAINSTTDNIDAIVLPKTMYLKEIIESSKLHISYNITEMKNYFVLKLGNNKKLNKIIRKYYKKWYRNNYDESFNNYFSDDYFSFKQIYEQEKANFRSKRYAYGFIDYAPYDKLKSNTLLGKNSEVIKQFSKVANVEISFEKFKNYEELLKAFNENKIDFYMNASSIDEYNLDVYNTVEVYNPYIVVLSGNIDSIVVNSEMSLDSYDVITIKNSKIDKYLDDNRVDAKVYDNIKLLLKNKKKTDVIVIDKDTYEAYMNKQLKNYHVDYVFKLKNGYAYTNRNISANEVFNEYLDFYISYINIKSYENKVKNVDFQEKFTDNKLVLSTLGVLIIVLIISIIVLIHKIMPKRKKIVITKEDKLKYIDMLTSLKNRNYLNDSMEKWDNSEIYPQAIIVIDLNNVAYINDNYGHEEGDNIIKEAAAILISTQIENTEIIRTNGNEFLIYMVEYDEKHVVSYIRKLHKELKELNHGFGAAIGYSMINDQLKTIDDAINEATLDMKNNKEEIQN